MDVLLVASPTYLVNRYVQLLTQSELEVLAIDTEPIAISRALTGFQNSALHTLLVSMGAVGIDLAVVRNGNLVATRSIATGGTAVTRAIMTELNLDAKQAEEYKKHVGLDDSKLSGSLTKAIAPILEVLVS